jgi:hypothetical protein
MLAEITPSGDIKKGVLETVTSQVCLEHRGWGVMGAVAVDVGDSQTGQGLQVLAT